MFTSTINEVKLMGNVAKKPELKEAINGSLHCRVDLATNRSYVDQHGEIHEFTDWIPVRFWRGHAKNANAFLEKGTRVHIEGRLETYSRMKNGERVYRMEVVATKMIVIDKKEKKYDMSDKKILS